MEYRCAYCDAIFEEERELLAHFCPMKPADADA
jgi:DNA-directed RNA polymerase subunit RPC12/RpoP